MVAAIIVHVPELGTICVIHEGIHRPAAQIHPLMPKNRLRDRVKILPELYYLGLNHEFERHDVIAVVI